MTEQLFDVFLAHNSVDKPDVREISQKLRERGLKPWLDEEQIPPGMSFQDEIQKAIPLIKSAAIIIGTQGLGNWQIMELRSLISKFVNQKIPVIPVLLPGVNNIPGDLLFLQEINWVKFEKIDDNTAFYRLQWGITQVKPELHPKTVQLTAKEWFNSGYNKGESGDNQGAIADYDQAAQLYIKSDASLPPPVTLEIHHEVLRESLEEQYHTEIPSILNKNAGKNFLENILPKQMVEKKAHTVTVVILDIDDLTIINKQYGKKVGDRVLRTVARLLRNNIPQQYTVGRCGDDTFFIVFIYLAENKAREQCYVLKRKLSGYKWSKIAANLRVTLSIGFATKHSDEPILDTIIRAAIGMNRAKEKGKNTIYMAPIHISNSQNRELRCYFS